MDTIDIYIKEFNKSKRNGFVAGCKTSKVRVKGVPQEIVDAVSRALGENKAAEWFRKPVPALNGKSPVEVLKMPDGEKALKTLVMRLHW